MENTPLTSNEQNRIFIFILLLLPTVFAGVGVLPALFLIFGFFMTKRSEDFGHIEVAIRNFKIYMVIITLVFAAYLAYNFFKYFYSSGRNITPLVILGLAFASAAYIYCIIINLFLLRPLAAHREWVAINGVFSSKNKLSKTSSASQTEIIKGEKLEAHSVADELIKWAQLKEGGHISELQYNEAKDKLLNRG